MKFNITYNAGVLDAIYPVAFCSMVHDSLCSLKEGCLIFFGHLHMGLDAALGMAAASFFVLNRQKRYSGEPDHFGQAQRRLWERP